VSFFRRRFWIRSPEQKAFARIVALGCELLQEEFPELSKREFDVIAVTILEELMESDPDTLISPSSLVWRVRERVRSSRL
jgi:hypothetical protein